MEWRLPFFLPVKALAEAVLERAIQLGLTWRLRPATIVGRAPGGGVRGVYDGDTEPVRMVSLIGPLPKNARVMVLCTPPSGNHVVGFIDGGSKADKFAVTVASGWGAPTTEHRIVGGVCYVRIAAARTGAAITATSAGNITDTAFATITEPSLRPAILVVQKFNASVTSGAVQASPSGAITLLDMHPTSTIAVNETVHVHLSYPLAGA